MSIDANKELVRLFHDEAINGRDSAACLRLLTDDFVHTGEFLGVPGSGKSVTFTSTAVLRISDGKIAQAWDEVDSLAFLQHVGALA